MATKNYEQIKQLVSALKPFVGNTMSAERYRTDDAFIYVVFSYQTPIALYVGNDVEPLGLHYSAYVTTSKYGVTSSKQTNIVLNNWASQGELGRVDESKLRDIINKWKDVAGYRYETDRG